MLAWGQSVIYSSSRNGHLLGMDIADAASAVLSEAGFRNETVFLELCGWLRVLLSFLFMAKYSTLLSSAMTRNLEAEMVSANTGA